MIVYEGLFFTNFTKIRVLNENEEERTDMKEKNITTKLLHAG